MARSSASRILCKFCAQHAAYIDFKNVRVLRRYIQSGGKIQPRRYSGTCPAHQHALATACKRARHVALLPFVR